MDKAARLVINDWNAGKLKYYTVPPGIDKNEFEKLLEKNQKDKNKKTGIEKVSHQKLLDGKGTKTIKKINVNKLFKMEEYGENERKDEKLLKKKRQPINVNIIQKATQSLCKINVKKFRRARNKN